MEDVFLYPTSRVSKQESFYSPAFWHNMYLYDVSPYLKACENWGLRPDSYCHFLGCTFLSLSMK